MVVKRAYDKEDKLERRDALIAATRALFSESVHQLPAVADIATRAGVAKGTVYLYFAAREALFAELLVLGWGGMLQQVESVMQSATPRTKRVSNMLEAISRYIGDHPELLRLDVLASGLIEQKLDPSALRQFKHALNANLHTAGTVIDKSLSLPDGRGTTLLVRTYALVRGLWLITGPDAHGLEMHHVPPTTNTFEEDVKEALNEYWRGALAFS